MFKDLLAALFTPVGAIIGALLLLAAGVAGPGIRQGLQGAAEFWRARLGRNGNGKHPAIKQADPPGERTAEGRKDLKALEQPDVEEVAFVRAAVEALDLRVTGTGGIQERVAIVERTCERIEGKVDALPQQFGQKVDALDAKLSEANEKAFRNMGVSLSKALVRLLRGTGAPLDRRTGPSIPLPPHRERRSDPEKSG